MQPCQEDSRSFFVKLQNAKNLDLRDNRGKRHNLATVLVGVTAALLANRDGCLSSIHRHLEHHYEKLMPHLGLEKRKPISRAQLPRMLEKVAVSVFDCLVFEHFGIRLSKQEKQWFAIDGKELRGSIEAGEKRGEALVQAVAQDSKQTVAQNYYSGGKESEVPSVRELVAENGLAGRKISLDALHCKPKTLELIVECGGRYLVGLKDNQKELKKQVLAAIARQAWLFKSETFEKEHGRLELRCYEFYDLLELQKDARWTELQLRTLVKVRRTREEIRSGHSSSEESYYLSNEIGNYEELAGAVRNHWSVEANNHVRDVSLKEDSLRSKKRNYNAQWAASGHWSQLYWIKRVVRIKKRRWRNSAMTLTN